MPWRQFYAGAALACIYIGSVVAANLLTTRYGLVTVWPAPALYATAGTFCIGGVIMTRDLLQDALGRASVYAAIVIGATLSYALTPSAAGHRIALASGATFLIAETLETLVYTPLRRRAGWGTRKWAGVVSVANGTGIVADTLLFLWLAGFPVTGPTVAGQLLAKAYTTVAVVALGVIIRRALLHPPVRATGP
jgi:uncharacterized PurR-regulated membrane protein YhhQ (DUF165 family)